MGGEVCGWVNRWAGSTSGMLRTLCLSMWAQESRRGGLPRRVGSLQQRQQQEQASMGHGIEEIVCCLQPSSLTHSCRPITLPLSSPLCPCADAFEKYRHKPLRELRNQLAKVGGALGGAGRAGRRCTAPPPVQCLLQLAVCAFKSSGPACALLVMRHGAPPCPCMLPCPPNPPNTKAHVRARQPGAVARPAGSTRGQHQTLSALPLAHRPRPPSNPTPAPALPCPAPPPCPALPAGGRAAQAPAGEHQHQGS